LSVSVKGLLANGTKLLLQVGERIGDAMKFKVTINVSGENHELFTTAKNDSAALRQAANKLAKKIGQNNK